MSYKPGDSYYGEFCTQVFDTGVATDADSLPVATVTKNGTDDGSSPTGWSNTLTVTKIDTGRYKIAGTIPSSYAAGDVIQMSVAATVNSVAGKAVGGSFMLDLAMNADLLTRLTNPGRITVTSPVASDGTITITQGDDYAVVDGTEITITKANYTGPLVTDDTVAFRVMTLENYDAGGEIAALTVVPAVAVGTDAVFTIQLTAAQTAALGPAPPANKLNYVYQLVGTSANGKVATEAIGALTVTAQVPAT